MSVLTRVQDAFRSAKGPAFYKFSSNGHFYNDDIGAEIESALLNLDPSDLTKDDINPDPLAEFLPSWTTDQGLRWLIPGIVRVALEPGAESPEILDDLFSELRKRLKDDPEFLSHEECQLLDEAYEQSWSAVFPYKPMANKPALGNRDGAGGCSQDL
ncbi:hypothetical protein [Sulfuriroseicoccus oceanibius]|uniref:Uncharacterized protein n=1 Tax=Sulfuriroseicoccus oceanibius TaxID=2707525 RepID=A0A6B3LBN4_9BACT|nr:hypothetical protein [Sulfuriroseicoccus oceanibius]QQL44610.1 hypothetical protein G3M56_012065 [Sulfuriroseicoccus oceanibius]